MTNYKIYAKYGTKYTLLIKECRKPNEVFFELSRVLLDKYVDHKGSYKIEKRRSLICDAFDEITVFYTFPNGDKIKTIYTVPIV